MVSFVDELVAQAKASFAITDRTPSHDMPNIDKYASSLLSLVAQGDATKISACRV